MGMGKPFFQAHGLDRQNFLTAFAPVHIRCRDKRPWVHIALQFQWFNLCLKRYANIGDVFILDKCGHTTALTAEPPQIQIRIDNASLKTFGFGKADPIFTN